MKLWEKNFEVNKEIERFTVGRDREMDLYLAKYDVLGSMAHITMLESIGLLEHDELPQLLAALKEIYQTAERGEFVIEEGVEDVHSQVEMILTRRLGDMGHGTQYIVFCQIEIHLTVASDGEALYLLVDLKVLFPEFHLLLFYLFTFTRSGSVRGHRLSSQHHLGVVSRPYS